MGFVKSNMLDDVACRKQHWRAYFRQARKDYLRAHPLAHEQAVVNLDRLLACFTQPKTVGLYWPLPHELDVTAILRRGNIHDFALPRMRGISLEFVSFQFSDPLLKGKFSVMEPQAGDLVDPEIVILPLLGMDHAGVRLGYGAGFYDKTFAMQPRPLLIGAGFGNQRVRHLPSSDHDVCLDGWVTDTGWQTNNRLL